MNVPIQQPQRAGDRGVALVMVVAIVGAAALAVAISSVIIGVSGLSSSFADNQAERALAVADACTQETWHRIRRNASYGGGQVTLRDGTCIITVTPSGQNRVVSVVASTSLDFYAKVRSSGTLSLDSVPTLSIEDWRVDTGE